MSSSQPQGEERRIVPFAIPSRRPRPLPGEGDPRGVVLLFTGVRYERLDAPSRPTRRPEPNALG